MSEAKYTKGPWVVEGPEDEPYGPIKVVAGKRHTIAKLWQDDSPEHDYNAEQWKNAKLIAAAPELLEALKEACKAHLSANGTKPPQEWLIAVAKAEGRL